MGIHEELNGLRLHEPGSKEQYLIDEGLKRFIPSQETFLRLFTSFANTKDWDLTTIDTGKPISAQALLAQGAGTTTTYFIDPEYRVKRPIPSIEAFNRYDFNKEKIQIVDPGLLAAIPTGDDMEMPRE